MISKLMGTLILVVLLVSMECNVMNSPHLAMKLYLIHTIGISTFRPSIKTQNWITQLLFIRQILHFFLFVVCFFFFFYTEFLYRNIEW